MKQHMHELLERNRQWADSMCREDPDFFSRLSQPQKPDYLWIGCSDSRVHANQIINLPPGEVFVHRNVANLLYHNDMNALSVVQYAVDVLKQILVVGHYGCGGVRAAMLGGEHGIVDFWLHSVRELHNRYGEELAKLDTEARVDRLCELNVKAQVDNLSRTKIIQSAWQRNQSLAIHGWIYGLGNGHVGNLDCTLEGLDQVPQLYHVDRLTSVDDA